jgi:hypothetical protein
MLCKPRYSQIRQYTHTCFRLGSVRLPSLEVSCNAHFKDGFSQVCHDNASLSGPILRWEAAASEMGWKVQPAQYRTAEE